MGMWRGAYTDHMIVPSSECTVIPDSLSVEVAGGFYTNYSTALFGLRDCGNLEAGENVLILGASGGVGSSAITVAKAMDANVIAGASSLEKLELASSAGADETILYSKEDSGPYHPCPVAHATYLFLDLHPRLSDREAPACVGPEHKESG